MFRTTGVLKGRTTNPIQRHVVVDICLRALSAKPVVRIVRKSDNAGAGNWVANWTPTDFDTYDNAILPLSTEHLRLLAGTKEKK